MNVRSLSEKNLAHALVMLPLSGVHCKILAEGVSVGVSRGEPRTRGLSTASSRFGSQRSGRVLGLGPGP